MPASNVLALDVGDKRVGLALARAEVRVPIILDALERQTENFWQQLTDTCQRYEIAELVIGLPRGLEGQDTAQTRSTKAFAEELKRHIDLPIHWQDEALTSMKATEVLESSGRAFSKQDIDSMAASLILSDYLAAEGPRK